MYERFARGPHVYHGHEGVREVNRVFEENLDDLGAEPHEFIDAGDAVVVPVRFYGKAKGTGEELSFELVHVWTARGERASRLDVYSSKEEALAAVGLSPGSD
jgi:ketosteroid isomerase-like protein